MSILRRVHVLMQCNCGCGCNCGCNSCGNSGSSFYVPSFSVRTYTPISGITGPTGATGDVTYGKHEKTERQI